MTLYWWMHWFWITSWTMAVFAYVPCECLSTASLQHSISTDLPILKIRSSTLLMQTTKTDNNESITQTPPITLSQPVEQRNESVSGNVSNILVKKNDSDFSNSTKKPGLRALSVINQQNSMENATIWINVSNNAINDVENLTYIRREEVSKPVAEERDKPVPDSSEINLSAAGITGITLGCIICVAAICGVSFFLYHNHGFNKPQVLNDRCSNPDSSGYIDDASVRDNSEEMYSLDNDSFLNSLEAMTIQNYWTDTVKHTKL